jgi:transcriptional regulator with GAF, ATPase, and Fis domain
MDALNKQERTEAFLKMLAFFLLAVIVISIPMYYAFRLPEKEDTLHRAECDSISVRLAEIDNFIKAFLIEADSAISIFNTYKEEQDEVLQDKLQLRFSEITNEMENSVRTIKHDTTRARLYGKAIFIYSNLFSTWVEKKDLQARLDDCMQDNTAIMQKKEIAASVENPVVEKKEMTIREKEIDLINKALKKHNGNVKAAAKELGTSERKLKKRMKELGIG